MNEGTEDGGGQMIAGIEPCKTEIDVVALTEGTKKHIVVSNDSSTIRGTRTHRRRSLQGNVDRPKVVPPTADGVLRTRKMKGAKTDGNSATSCTCKRSHHRKHRSSSSVKLSRSGTTLDVVVTDSTIGLEMEEAAIQPRLVP
ncbi:hypothetical protein V6N13_073230 [Hibiscus sabdariffa]|uniref:Uncharacterized protein n=1 Tax=Hibiscus sabdariffa TaxID=183260 RepID=A0ABR2E931_9ROSI